MKKERKKFKIKILYFDFIHPWRIISIVVALNKVKWAHTKIDFGLMPKPNLRSSCWMLQSSMSEQHTLCRSLATSRNSHTRSYRNGRRCWPSLGAIMAANWSIPLRESECVCDVCLCVCGEPHHLCHFIFQLYFAPCFALHFVRRFCCWFAATSLPNCVKCNFLL